jgi:glycosyltransferase involved in cell wall biosynthesis
MKVAFTPFVDAQWTGGLHYLRNLFSALAEVPGRPLEPVLFVPPGTPPAACELLRPVLQREPVVVQAWGGRRSLRLLSAFLTGHDRSAEAAFRAAGIDLVFENDTWYGSRFALPTLAWIADFQHCHLRHLFSAAQRFKRSAKYRAYCTHASGVMVSSDDGRQDCEALFPIARGRVDAVPFAVELPPAALQTDAMAVAARHCLPPKFFYFPSQMWRHKNHATLVEALRLLKARGAPVVVALSGNAADAFRPDHPGQVLATVEREGLQTSFRFLGHIPYADIMPLMRASAAVINPSLFEGWSTPVEEAKALGVPLVLSGLRVHREQAPEGTRFFAPESATDMADALQAAWQSLQPGPRPLAERDAVAAYRLRRAEFGRRFIDVAARAVARHAERRRHA